MLIIDNNLIHLEKFIISNSKRSFKFSDRFCIDSRKVKPGQIFISVDCDESKNLKNIKNAIFNGASGFVTEYIFKRKDLKTSIPFFIQKKINNIYHMLFKVDLTGYKHKVKTIGITGTNGKTSSVLLLAQSLTYLKKKVGVITSEGCGIYPALEGSDYTTPTIDIIYKYYTNFVSNECDYIIIECSSQGLHQGRVKGLLFDYACITNIHNDHLDYHKTLKNYIDSKLLILKQSKKAILNLDSSIIKKNNFNRLRNIKFFYFSKSRYKNKKILSTYKKDNKISIHNQDFKLDKIKKNHFNIYSLLMICSILKLENYGMKLINSSINALNELPGRRQVIRTKNKGTFIIDYAHTTQSFRDIYAEFKSYGYTTTLFGCGGDRDPSKRTDIAKIVDRNSSFSIITEDNSRNEKLSSIINNIKSGLNGNKRYVVIKSRKTAIKYLFANSSKKHINFILGKGNENYLIKNNSKVEHNDIIYLNNLINEYES
jgi:UDP-N-acetylmuramoyl-L-alanyl-D-glutamate--2,6-diaminopimelate ligase